MQTLLTICLCVVHAAVIAINEAIIRENAEVTLAALMNAEAHLIGVSETMSECYQSVLFEAKQNKAETARNKVLITYTYLAPLPAMVHICVHYT